MSCFFVQHKIWHILYNCCLCLQKATEVIFLKQIFNGHIQNYCFNILKILFFRLGKSQYRQQMRVFNFNNVRKKFNIFMWVGRVKMEIVLFCKNCLYYVWLQFSQSFNVAFVQTLYDYYTQ